MTELHLMPHQEQVLDATESFNRVAYFLDMGLGKTFIGAEKMYLLNNDLNLVICQKSKIDDWIDHFQTYYPDYAVYNLTRKKQAMEFRNRVDCMDLYEDHRQLIGVINYETAFRRDWLKDLQGFTLMLDESSLISNENAQRSRFILKLSPESVILLSGTPTAGKYEKLWSQCKLLGWNISKQAFYNSYVITKWVDVGGFQREVITGYKNVEHLKQKLSDYGAVFMKSEEVFELPEQIEIPMKVSQSKEYKDFIKNRYVKIRHLNPFVAGMETGEEIELVGDNSLTRMLYARQLCGQYQKDKIQMFDDLIHSTDDRLIVFYNFTEELEILTEVASNKTEHISVVNGKHKELNDYFLYSDSITFVQYQAGAMGLNLQKANKVIYFTLPLGKGSCDLWEQSKKRVHRIGQNKTCFYYYLLVKGSIEERNLAALRVGKELTDELFKKD